METEVMEIIREQHGEYEKERKQGSWIYDMHNAKWAIFKVHIYIHAHWADICGL